MRLMSWWVYGQNKLKQNDNGVFCFDRRVLVYSYFCSVYTTLYLCIDVWNYVDVGDDNSHQIVITCSLQDFSDRLHLPFVTMTAWSHLCVEITEKSLQTDCVEKEKRNIPQNYSLRHNDRLVLAHCCAIFLSYLGGEI